MFSILAYVCRYFMFAILHVCSDFQQHNVCALQEVLVLSVCM